MDLSIIIPTFNEENSVNLIIKQIITSLKQEICSYEILFIDDSRDNTPVILEQLVQQFQQVRLIHRPNKTGLASAVVEGFQHCRGDKIIVMDADLQHPPTLLPLILTRLSQADIVIPSRFITGGSAGGLNGFRRFVSWSARTIGRLALKKLRNISDCTGGFFVLNRSVIKDIPPLDPIGWKILIEVLVKGNYHSIHEIPYTFQTRDNGSSKMRLTEQLNYLRHISRLIMNSPEDRRFYVFCMIGALGVLINLLGLNILLNVFQLDSITASLQASLIAIIHNFFLNDIITWRERKQLVGRKRLTRFPQFLLICGLGIAVTTLAAQLFVLAGISIYGGQLLGIILSSRWTFIMNNKWTWATAETGNHEVLVVTQELHSKPS